MKQKDLPSREREIQIGPLLHHANQTLGLYLLLPDLVCTDPGFAAGGPHAGSEDADGGGLAGAVWAQQSKNFAGIHIEGNSIYRDDFDLLLVFAFLPLGPAIGSTHHRQGRRCVVDLAQVPRPNAYLHTIAS